MGKRIQGYLLHMHTNAARSIAGARAGLMRARRRRLRSVAAILAALGPAALGLALAAPAAAAGGPTATTGGPQQVSYSSAVLTGWVDPNGRETSYYFQWGLTRAYGGQTAIADAGTGTRTVQVALPVAGLQPLTRYHYRLVAVSAAGVSQGFDHTLLTSKVPLSLQILTSPDPVRFGGTVTVEGTLSGTENANRGVVLQANSFPFTAGFVDLGNAELTSASGGFSFPVIGLTVITQFRVVTNTNPPVISSVAAENVAVSVSSHVGRARRPGFVRIYGTVTPGEDGMEVGILRIVHGRGVLVGGTLLRPDGANRSAFSSEVHATAGVYRVLVRVTGGGQVSSYGQPLLIR